MFGSLRVRNFRLFASGQVVTNVGIWMQRIAQDWLVLVLTDYDPVALGIAGTLQFAPTLLLSLWAGVLADRLDKRRLLMLVQTGAAACALVLGVLDMTGLVTLWHVYLLCVALGVFSAIDTPIRQSFVAELVGRENLANAVALNSSSFNLARIVGPAIAGVMIIWTGTGWVFLVNAVSMGAAIVGLQRMNPAELHRAEGVPRGPAQLREGLRYVRGHPEVLTLLVLVFCVSLFAINFYTVLPIVAANVFGRGAEGYGLLFTLLAIGTLAGSLLAARRGSRGNPGPRFLVGSAICFGVLEVVAGLMPNYLTYGLALIPVGVAMMTFMPTANSTVQLAVVPHMRGRVMGLYMLVFLGSNPIGAPLSGWVAAELGGRAPLVLGGALAALSAVVCGLVLFRRPGSDASTAAQPDTTPAPTKATAP